MGAMQLNAGYGESGTENQQAGDQTGTEVYCRNWTTSHGSWDEIFRYKDREIAQKIANYGKKLCDSPLVGYDYNGRCTLYQQLKKNNWDVDAYISSGVKTECDCSSFVYTISCAFIPEMRTYYESYGNCPTTYVMNGVYQKWGWTMYTNSKYLTSGNYQLAGDIYNREAYHTCMAYNNGYLSGVDDLDVGYNVTDSSSSTTSNLNVITNCANVTMSEDGSACGISFTPSSKSYSYVIKFTYDGYEESTDYIKPNTTESFTYVDHLFKIENWASHVNTSEYGLCVVTLETYKDGDQGAKVLVKSSTANFRLYVPNSVVPSLEFTIEPYGEMTQYGYLQTFTKAHIVSTMTPAYGASVKISDISLNGESLSNPSDDYITKAVSQSGTNTISVTATDVRGHSTTVEQTFEVKEYFAPYINSLRAVRCNESGEYDVQGAYMYLYGELNFCNLGDNNFHIYAWMMNREDDFSYSEPQIINEQVSNLMDLTEFGIFDANINTNFTIYIVLNDEIQDSSPILAYLDSTFSLLEFYEDGTGMGIGTIAKKSGTLDVALPIETNKNITSEYPSDISFWQTRNSAYDSTTNSYSKLIDDNGKQQYSEIGFGIGQKGINRGLYDNTLKKNGKTSTGEWMFYRDSLTDNTNKINGDTQVLGNLQAENLYGSAYVAPDTTSKNDFFCYYHTGSFNNPDDGFEEGTSSISSGANTTLCTINLDEGAYLLDVYVEWDKNNTGYRYADITYDRASLVTVTTTYEIDEDGNIVGDPIKENHSDTSESGTTTTTDSSLTINGYKPTPIDAEQYTYSQLREMYGKRIWDFYRTYGMTEQQCAGILGNMAEEGDFDPFAIECDWIYDAYGYNHKYRWCDEKMAHIGVNNSNMCSYTKNQVYSAYARSGISLIKSVYESSRYGAACGAGLIGWTGSAYDLLWDWALRFNKHWYDKECLELELSCIIADSSIGGYGKGEWLSQWASQKVTDISTATKQYTAKVQGNTGYYGITNRINNAYTWYNKFAGTTVDEEYGNYVIALSKLDTSEISTTSVSDTPTTVNVMLTDTPTTVDATEDATTTETTTYTYKVTASALNIRESGNASSAVVGSLANGTEVTVTEISGGWGKISQGWICLKYCSLVSTNVQASESASTEVATTTVTSYNYKVTASSLNLRESYSTSSTILAVIPNGTEISVTETANNWGKTTYGEHTGWCSLKYCELIDTSTSTTTTDSSSSSEESSTTTLKTKTISTQTKTYTTEILNPAWTDYDTAPSSSYPSQNKLHGIVFINDEVTKLHIRGFQNSGSKLPVKVRVSYFRLR